jgi:hypothetical protein
VDAVNGLKALVLSKLAVPADTAIAVNEILCNDPGCPGIETVVLVMIPGQKTRALKVQKPLAEVTEADVAAMLAPPQE